MNKILILIILFTSIIGLSQDFSQEEISEFLDSHNKYRMELGLPKLEWSTKLSKNASKWGEKIKRNQCDKINGTRHSNDIYGENIAWNSGFEQTPEGVVDLWASEKIYFIYNKFPDCCSSICGHYTQIIWKDTKRVGCALVQCGNEQVWICQYDPPGNYIGEKPY